jgi:hypothetical protein
MRKHTGYLSKATDRQLALIRHLESEFDPPIRFSHETMQSLSAGQAGQVINDLYEMDKKRQNARQTVLL